MREDPDEAIQQTNSPRELSSSNNNKGKEQQK
jgi:hypothetical protein